MSFTEHVAVESGTEGLLSDELQLLADMCLELAERYERNAPFLDSDEDRKIALWLSRWRRDRGRRFRELSAQAERVETSPAPHAGPGPRS